MALVFGKTLEKTDTPYPKLLFFSLGDGRRLRFWKDIWCGEVALSNAFPNLFNLAVHKEAMVSGNRCM